MIFLRSRVFHTNQCSENSLAGPGFGIILNLKLVNMSVTVLLNPIFGPDSYIPVYRACHNYPYIYLV